MSAESRQPRVHATAVAVAPLALVAAVVAHPYVAGRLPNDAAVAAAVAADTTRWGLVHLGTTVASTLMILAFLAIRVHLRDLGDRHSGVGVPFVVVGSVLFGLLPGLEFAPLTVAETGGDLADIAAAQGALEPWFVPILAIGAATFAIGVFAFARGIAGSALLGRRTTAVVVAGLALFAVARFVPFAAVQFYVQGAAALVAFLPLASAMWRRSRTAPARPDRERAREH